MTHPPFRTPLAGIPASLARTGRSPSAALVPTRALLLVSLLLASQVPGRAPADTLEVTSRVTDVTIYAQGAEVTRAVSFTAPAGLHDLIITDLPQDTAPEFLRLTPADGLQVGAYAIRTDRLPPREEILSDAQKAARAEVERLEAAERTAEAGIAAIEARVAAAAAQVAFLRGLGAGEKPLDAGSAEAVRSVVQMIGQEVLAAGQSSLAAQTEQLMAEDALADLQEDLEQARAAFDALARPDAEYAALSVAVALAADGPATLTIRHFVYDAAWQPVYDLALTRSPVPSLTVARGALVSQYSGEDWVGVALTLSTAQPSAQSSPGTLWPQLRRIVPEADLKSREMARAAAGETMMEAPSPEPTAAVVGDAMSAAVAQLQGDVVVYRFGTAVDVASGVDNLRIALDELVLAPEIRALAVPRLDQTAYLNATLTNSTDEVLLPGTAFLLREGTLVGSTQLDAIPPGAEADVAFGAIDGLQLTRDMPLRNEGDSGIITQTSRIEETAILEVANLTGETWPVRLIDQVPYSEQEDLEITYAADPAPTETDVDGQRGILAWEFDIAPGETRRITLDHLMRWPEEMVLQ